MMYRTKHMYSTFAQVLRRAQEFSAVAVSNIVERYPATMVRVNVIFLINLQLRGTLLSN